MTDLLAELLKKGSLKVLSSTQDHEGLVEMLRRTDLSIDYGVWVAEGHSGNITIRPYYGGRHEAKITPNRFLDKKRVDKEWFAEVYGVSIDDLLAVEGESVNITKDGTEVNYRILLSQESRVDPYLTIRSYYKPIEV